jgi:hypothetical protein
LRNNLLQNNFTDGNSNISNASSSGLISQHQMNFDYNNQTPANGLELAGFCSPSGDNFF